jgi:RNA polymerase sigma-70 factor (ECF subfamily)
VYPVSDLRSEFERQKPALRGYVEDHVPRELRAVIAPDDILQEVWIAASKGISSLRSPHSVGSWLRRIAERELVDALRIARSRKRGGGHTYRPGDADRSSFVGPLGRVAAAQRTPSSEDAAREATEAVKEALAGLPPQQRRAVELYHIKGLSRDEVAMLMRRSGSAVNSLLYRGLRVLKNALGSAERFFSRS